MKILLTGGNGQVGRELRRTLAGLGEVIATDRGTLDLADPDAIRRAVRFHRPCVIVNAGAYTAVERAETEPDLARRVNATAPGILAEEAENLGGLLVHFSTDYVFDGGQPRPYREDDARSPVNTYGRTKLEGELAIEASKCRWLLLRTSWVYAPHGRNFFITVAGKAAAGEALRVVCDQHGAPTEARFLAETATALVERGAQGVFHTVPSGTTTWHGFAQAIVHCLGFDVPVQSITSGEYVSAARRPQSSSLATGRLAEALGEAPLPWDIYVARCATEWRSCTRGRGAVGSARPPIAG